MSLWAIAMSTSDVEVIFHMVRAKAAQGQLIVLRPDLQWLALRALPRDAAPPQMIASVERMIPPTIKRNIAVIGDTSWAMDPEANLHAANQAIPFFGLLMGFGTIGHCVWIFDGSSFVLNAGCRDADVLIVDDACLANLPNDWQGNALKVMRKPQIFVHDRAKYQLRKP
jgi:hypothetical protein